MAPRSEPFSYHKKEMEEHAENNEKERLSRHADQVSFLLTSDQSGLAFSVILHHVQFIFFFGREGHSTDFAFELSFSLRPGVLQNHTSESRSFLAGSG